MLATSFCVHCQVLEVRHSLEFVNCGDDANDLQVERDLGVGLVSQDTSPTPCSFPDPEQQAAGTETVSTHRVAVWVLGPEVEFEPLGRVSVDSRDAFLPWNL